MLPFGLEVMNNRPIKKIPMRLEIQSLEDKHRQFCKMLNIDPNDDLPRKRRTIKTRTKNKPNKTKKTHKH